MLHIKNIGDKMASFICLEKQPQSALKMLNMQTMCSSIFGGKATWAYCSLWAGVVGFVLVLVHDSHRSCCLWNEVTPTEGVPLLDTGFYNLSSLYKWHNCRQNLPRRGFLQKPFVKELAEKEWLLHKSCDLPLHPRRGFCLCVQVAGFS